MTDAERINTKFKLLRGKNALLKKALRAFMDGYPNREWEGILHEEGCSGVNHRKEDREQGWPCRCDGDYLTSLVKKALR